MYTPLDLSGMTKQWLLSVSLCRVQSPTMDRTRLRPANTLYPQDVNLMLGSAGVVSMSKSYLVPFLGCLPVFVLARLTGRVQSPTGAGPARSALSAVQQSKHWCGYAAAHLPNLLVNAQGAFLNVPHVGHNQFIN